MARAIGPLVVQQTLTKIKRFPAFGLSSLFRPSKRQLAKAGAHCALMDLS